MDPEGNEEMGRASPRICGPWRVAVIVPAYQSRRYLPACLTSLEHQAGVTPFVIVSDNGSTDGSQDYIRAHHPSVLLLENRTNPGFSAAVNRALARAAGSPFIALLNPDAFLIGPDCLARMAQGLIDTPGAGIAAARMVISDPPNRIDCLGQAATSSFGQVSIGRGWHAFPGFEEKRFVPAACGGGMMIRSEVIERIGGFDEDYFLCWEDLEFSLRAFRSGFRCLYLPEAVIFHAPTSIMGRWSGKNVFNYCRGALPTAFKLLPFRDLLRLLPSMLLHRVKAVALFASGGRLGSAIQGELSSIPLAWRMLKKRRTLPPPCPGFRLRDLLEEGDRIRMVMKYESPSPVQEEMKGDS